MSQADEPTLFPREWIIGRAAADLVREDEGVLLDQAWAGPRGGSATRVGREQPAPVFTAKEPPGRAEDQVPTVLLDGPPAAPTQSLSPPGPSSAPPLHERAAGRHRAQRPTAAEIEELKAGQARLQRRFEAARARPRPRYVALSATAPAVAHALPAATPVKPVGRRPFPWRRLAILLLLALLASSLYQYRAVLLQI